MAGGAGQSACTRRRLPSAAPGTGPADAACCRHGASATAHHGGAEERIDLGLLESVLLFLDLQRGQAASQPAPHQGAAGYECAPACSARRPRVGSRAAGALHALHALRLTFLCSQSGCFTRGTGLGTRCMAAGIVMIFWMALPSRSLRQRWV